MAGWPFLSWTRLGPFGILRPIIALLSRFLVMLVAMHCLAQLSITLLSVFRQFLAIFGSILF